ncbi:MAG TPA: LamB/YcsF family protein, partial [Aeromicrobium sp.]|nr:LamB/YcsF family protein [Aeromicrobium sp.]
FADRRYALSGTLVPRSEPGAVLHSPDAAASQVVDLLPSVRSICVHGDTVAALEIARAVRSAVETAGATLVGLHR